MPKKLITMIFLSLLVSLYVFGAGNSSIREEGNMGNSTNTSIYNVLNFGAIANGKVDDTKAINSAINYAAEHGGGIVWLPIGSYKIEGTIFVYPGIVLEGAAWRALGAPPSNTTTILAYPSSKSTESSFLKPVMPTIYLSDGSTVKDLVVYYPDQDVTHVIPYPPAIGGSGNMMTVENVTLINPYIGIDFMGGTSSLHYIKNVYGSPLHIGIEIDNCFDIGRVENVHFNPNFWQPGNGDLETYIHNHLYAFIIGRSDWEYFLNTFVWGAKVGYLFEQTSQGACNGNFVGIGSDWSGRAVWVKASQPMGIQVVNGEFVGSPVAPAVIEVDSGKLMLSNSTIWGPAPKEDILLNNGTVMVNSCNFESWASNGSNNAPAIKAINGRLMVSNSLFVQSGLAIQIGKGVYESSITGNIFQSPTSESIIKEETIPKGNSASITLGKSSRPEGLELINQPDGITQDATVGGREAIQPVPTANPGMYIYFRVSNELLTSLNQATEVNITLTYYNNKEAKIQLQYGSTDLTAPVNGAYTPATIIEGTGTNTWEEYTYRLTNALFKHGENGGADFRFQVFSDKCYINKVVVSW